MEESKIIFVYPGDKRSDLYRAKKALEIQKRQGGTIYTAGLSQSGFLPGAKLLPIAKNTMEDTQNILNLICIPLMNSGNKVVLIAVTSNYHEKRVRFILQRLAPPNLIWNLEHSEDNLDKSLLDEFAKREEISIKLDMMALNLPKAELKPKIQNLREFIGKVFRKIKAIPEETQTDEFSHTVKLVREELNVNWGKLANEDTNEFLKDMKIQIESVCDILENKNRDLHEARKRMEVIKSRLHHASRQENDARLVQLFIKVIEKLERRVSSLEIVN